MLAFGEKRYDKHRQHIMSSFVIVFLSRSKRLLISWLQSLSTVILEDVNYILRVWTRQNLKTDDIDPY